MVSEQTPDGQQEVGTAPWGERAVVAEMYRADATGLGHRALLGNTRQGGRGGALSGDHYVGVRESFDLRMLRNSEAKLWD